jgi:hypothetical protein
MDTQHLESPTEPSPSPTTAPYTQPPTGHRRKAGKSRTTTRPLSPLAEAQQTARADDILTEHGFLAGYVVLKPSRWLGRFWLDIERFNTALQRVETNTFTLLGNRQVDFTPHLQAFLAVLADYRVTTRRLTRHAHALASGRVQELHRLTQQTLDAWLDDPAPAETGDGPPLADLAGEDIPSPATELTALHGLSLAEVRATARAGETD